MVTVVDLARARDAALEVRHFFRLLCDRMITWAESAKAQSNLKVNFSESAEIVQLQTSFRQGTARAEQRRYWFLDEMHEASKEILTPLRAYNEAMTSEVADAFLLGDPVVIQPDASYGLQHNHTAHALVGEIMVFNMFSFFIGPANLTVNCHLLNVYEIVPHASLQREFAAAAKRLEQLRPAALADQTELSPREILLRQRDKRIYDRRAEGASWQSLVNEWKSHPDMPLTSVSGIKDAVKRHADNHGLDPPAPGKGGRPRKYKPNN